MSESQIPPSSCRRCGTINDCAVHYANGPYTPRVGDLNICAYCGEMSIYAKGLALRPLTDNEREEIPQAALKVSRFLSGRRPN